MFGCLPVSTSVKYTPAWETNQPIVAEPRYDIQHTLYNWWGRFLCKAVSNDQVRFIPTWSNPCMASSMFQKLSQTCWQCVWRHFKALVWKCDTFVQPANNCRWEPVEQITSHKSHERIMYIMLNHPWKYSQYMNKSRFKTVFLSSFPHFAPLTRQVRLLNYWRAIACGCTRGGPAQQWLWQQFSFPFCHPSTIFLDSVLIDTALCPLFCMPGT